MDESDDTIAPASDHEDTDQSEGEANDPNIFTGDTDSKIVEKNTIGSELTEAVKDSKNALSADLASAARLMSASQDPGCSKQFNLNSDSWTEASSTTSEVSTADSENTDTTKTNNLASTMASAETADCSKPCNLNVEAGLSKESRCQTKQPPGARLSANEYQQLAFEVREKAAETNDAAASGRVLLETIHQTIGVIQASVDGFLETANEPEESECCRDNASKYGKALRILKKRRDGVETAVLRAEEVVAEAIRCADAVEKAPDDAPEEERLAYRVASKFWTNQAEESCVLVLQKKHSALLAMRKIWVDVKEDLREADGSSVSASSNSSNIRNQQQECYRFEDRTRKMDIAHVVAFLIGVSLLASTALFKTGSDSFKAVLVLGLLITGWATMYWILKAYRYIRLRMKQNTAVTVNTVEAEDAFLVNVNSRLDDVEEELRKHDAAPLSDSESERGGSLETVQVDDISQRS